MLGPTARNQIETAKACFTDETGRLSYWQHRHTQRAPTRYEDLVLRRFGPPYSRSWKPALWMHLLSTVRGEARLSEQARPLTALVCPCQRQRPGVDLEEAQ